MKSYPSLICFAILTWLAPAAPGASPVVSNVTAVQRAGTKLVDITYDVTADTPTVIVSLEISSNGGTTFSVPAAAISGAVGERVPVGTGRAITWNAGADWSQQYSELVLFKVTANDTPAFALIPAGTFQMGDQSSPRVGFNNELPVRTVQLSGFYIGKYEVSKEEWDVARTWALINGYTDLAAGSGKLPNHPVQTVSWLDAVKWCNARSEKEGLTPCYTVSGSVMKTGTTVPTVNWTASGYRLPTEAEWEKAARGGLSGKLFPWGDIISHDQANFQNIDGESFQTGTTGYHPTYNDGVSPYSAPVGSFSANGFGLHDMAGNLWEWCWDWYGTYPSGAQVDPRGAATGTSRILRGGAWTYAAYQCRVTFRGGGGDRAQSSENGFRPVRKSAPVGGSALAATSNVVVDTRAKVKLTIDTQHGTVTGAGEYSPSSTAILTATADPGYVFSAWTGDVSGSANPLSLLMDTNKTVGATLVPDLSDTDGDLLTAYDEATIHGTDPTRGDTDGDGLNDGYELGTGRFSVVSGSRTWAQAKEHAESQGGTLATFANEGEWNRAMLSIGGGALYDIGGLWIGATDEAAEGTWDWITGETFTFANWAVGQPDNLNDSDYAAVAGDLGGTVGKWYDYRSSTIRDGYLLETGYSTNPTDPDSDDDGLDDGIEALAGSNPFVTDTDGDNLKDAQEVNLTHTNPKLADSDGDGLDDAADDQDGDSLSNLAEITQHGTEPLKADTDNDGLSDSAELNNPASYFALVSGTFTYLQAVTDAAARHGRVASFPREADYSRVAEKARQTTYGYLWIGLSDVATEGAWQWTTGNAATYHHWLAGEPGGGLAENNAVIMEDSTKWADAADNFVAAGYLLERTGLDPLAPDTDGDGLNDGEEVNTTLSDPTQEDTDGDGLLDGAEVNTHHSSPLKDDTDYDGLNDREEVLTYHSNPVVKDTDCDGFYDFFEVNTGFSPSLATSTPDALSSIRTAVEFRFNAANGSSYRIEASTDLNAWTIIEPSIIGQGGVVTRFYSIENLPHRYLRVRRN